MSIQESIHDGVPQSRAGRPLAVGRSEHWGCVTLDKRQGRRVVGVQVPFGTDYESVAIRVHERIHAAHRPIPNSTGVLPITIQAVEDMLVYKRWPAGMPDRERRASIYMALADSRRVARVDVEDVDSWNQAVLESARAAAILGFLGATDEQKRMARKRIRRSLGAIVLDKILSEVMDLLARGRTRKAAIAIDELMRRQVEPDSSGGSRKGNGPKGDNRPKGMVIECPPLTAPCARVSPAQQRTRSGGHIVPSRLARAVVSGSSAGLFRRRRCVAPTGTWLFDASGSMGIESYRLASVCAAAPGATVAYYSDYGWDRDDLHRYGTLVVWARGGRRADRIVARGGGNDVDYWAVKWLLEQPGPRYLVSDLGFCGGPAWQAGLAEKLLEQAGSAVRVIESVWQAEELLGL